MARKKTAAAAPPALRRENVETERVNVYIPSNVVTALRVRCAETRRSISDGVTDAIRAWLESEGKGKR
jgi:hypothetical protein